MGKRFLRDRVLDEMIDELHRMQSEMARDAKNAAMDQHFATLHVMYETSRIVLERLEEVLEQMRVGVTSEEMIIPIAEAATHLQNGLRTIHHSLKEGGLEEISTDEFQAEINAAQDSGLFDPIDKEENRE